MHTAKVFAEQILLVWSACEAHFATDFSDFNASILLLVIRKKLSLLEFF